MNDPPQLWQLLVPQQFLGDPWKNIIYDIQFYGDGDSKSYEKVKNLYTGVGVEKFECVGHIQKRVGNRLRKKK